MIKAMSAMLALVLLTACAGHKRLTDRDAVLHGITSQLAGQVHECVPLGWRPVPVMASYYAGYTARPLGVNDWLPPMWAASVPTSELHRPKVRQIVSVLNELVRLKLVTRKSIPRGYEYRLTMRAVPYFYGENRFGNNPDHWPYLCYSTIAPKRVLWVQRPHLESDPFTLRTHRVFRAEFSWTAGPAAPWADDPVLRTHSVILAPTQSPTVAKFVDWDGDWEIGSIYSRGTMLPALSN